LLAHALALGSNGSTAANAAALAEQPQRRLLQDDQGAAIADRFVTAIRMLPPLLPGVRSGLEHARAAGADVWVLTEAHAELQRSRIANLGLDDLVEGVSEVSKTIEQFGRQICRFAPRSVIVFGDQPDRDIVPASTAGCRTVLIPSRFKPFWFRKDPKADYVAASFADAMTWALKTEKLAS
jgi:putative hydrolase of the HAD superfamily